MREVEGTCAVREPERTSADAAEARARAHTLRLVTTCRMGVGGIRRDGCVLQASIDNVSPANATDRDLDRDLDRDFEQGDKPITLECPKAVPPRPDEVRSRWGPPQHMDDRILRVSGLEPVRIVRTPSIER